MKLVFGVRLSEKEFEDFLRKVANMIPNVNSNSVMKTTKEEAFDYVINEKGFGLVDIVKGEDEEEFYDEECDCIEDCGNEDKKYLFYYIIEHLSSCPKISYQLSEVDWSDYLNGSKSAIFGLVCPTSIVDTFIVE